MRLSVDDYYDRHEHLDVGCCPPWGCRRRTSPPSGRPTGWSRWSRLHRDVLTNAMDAEDVVTRVHSLPAGGSALNQIKLVAGRLPEKPGECVVLKTKTLTGVEEGERHPLSAENDDLTDVLAVEGFTVVGLVETPYYMSIEKETSTVGAGHVQLTLYAGEDSFAYPRLHRGQRVGQGREGAQRLHRRVRGRCGHGAERPGGPGENPGGRPL